MASGGGRKAVTYKAVNTVFKEPIYKLLSKIKTQPFFKWPQPMRSDPSSWDESKFCPYHKQNGHRTEDCKTFKAHLETLVKDGHLRDHVKEEGRDSGRPCHQNDDSNDSELEASSMSFTLPLRPRVALRPVPRPGGPPTRSRC